MSELATSLVYHKPRTLGEPPLARLLTAVKRIVPIESARQVVRSTRRNRRSIVTRCRKTSYLYSISHLEIAGNDSYDSY